MDEKSLELSSIAIHYFCQDSNDNFIPVAYEVSYRYVYLEYGLFGDEGKGFYLTQSIRYIF